MLLYSNSLFQTISNNQNQQKQQILAPNPIYLVRRFGDKLLLRRSIWSALMLKLESVCPRNETKMSELTLATAKTHGPLIASSVSSKH